MYKCLLVDDEPRICSGLKELIDWDAYGFSQIDIALNGHEAFQKVMNTQYHLIITDIKMPGMDGLELISRLKESSCHSRFIILSGYSEFEYAKKAIGFGVSNYILKPVDENILIQSICSICDEIDKENMDKISRSRYSQNALMQLLIC